MGFEHSRSPDEALTRVVAHGDVDFEQCVAAIRTLASDLEGEPGLGILVDVRGTDYVGNSSDVRRYAEMVDELESLRGRRIAVIVGSTAQFGMARAFIAYHAMRGGSGNVFQTLEPALLWMGEPQRT